MGTPRAVSVLGSDEKRAEQRELRRRMRRQRSEVQPELLSFGVTTCQRQRGSCRRDCAQLLSGISFRKRLRGRSSVRWRCRATGLVSAATWLAGFLTWRVDEDARSRGGPYWSRNQRYNDRHQNHDPAQH